jgi:hypothetical protein
VMHAGLETKAPSDNIDMLSDQISQSTRRLPIQAGCRDYPMNIESISVYWRTSPTSLWSRQMLQEYRLSARPGCFAPRSHTLRPSTITSSARVDETSPTVLLSASISHL